MILKAFIWVALIVTPFITSAQVWSLLSKSVDECILEGVKAGMSNSAAEKVTRACQREYKTSSGAYDDSRSFLEKCGFFESYTDNERFFLRKGPHGEHAAGVLKKVSDIKFDGEEISNRQNDKVTFYNGNDFGVNGLIIGRTNKKSCPSAIDEYDYIQVCGVYRPGGGRGVVSVKPYSKSSLNCREAPQKVFKMGFCLLGYGFDSTTGSSTSNLFRGSVVFTKRMGICK